MVEIRPLNLSFASCQHYSEIFVFADLIGSRYIKRVDSANFGMDFGTDMAACLSLVRQNG